MIKEAELRGGRGAGSGGEAEIQRSLRKAGGEPCPVLVEGAANAERVEILLAEIGDVEIAAGADVKGGFRHVGRRRRDGGGHVGRKRRGRHQRHAYKGRDNPAHCVRQSESRPVPGKSFGRIEAGRNETRAISACLARPVAARRQKRKPDARGPQPCVARRAGEGALRSAEGRRRWFTNGPRTSPRFSPASIAFPVAQPIGVYGHEFTREDCAGRTGYCFTRRRRIRLFLLYKGDASAYLSPYCSVSTSLCRQ